MNNKSFITTTDNAEEVRVFINHVVTIVRTCGATRCRVNMSDGNSYFSTETYEVINDKINQLLSTGDE